MISLPLLLHQLLSEGNLSGSQDMHFAAGWTKYLPWPWKQSQEESCSASTQNDLRWLLASFSRGRDTSRPSTRIESCPGGGQAWSSRASASNRGRAEDRKSRSLLPAAGHPFLLLPFLKNACQPLSKGEAPKTPDLMRASARGRGGCPCCCPWVQHPTPDRVPRGTCCCFLGGGPHRRPLIWLPCRSRSGPSQHPRLSAASLSFPYVPDNHLSQDCFSRTKHICVVAFCCFFALQFYYVSVYWTGFYLSSPDPNIKPLFYHAS